MRTAEILRVHNISHLPGAAEIRLEADLRFGPFTARATILIPCADNEAGNAGALAIGQAIAPEFGAQPFEEYFDAPNGERVIVRRGKTFGEEAKGNVT